MYALLNRQRKWSMKIDVYADIKMTVHLHNNIKKGHILCDKIF